MYSAERSILGTALVQSDTRTITNCIVLTCKWLQVSICLPYRITYFLCSSIIKLSLLITFIYMQRLALMCYVHRHFHIQYACNIQYLLHVCAQPHNTRTVVLSPVLSRLSFLFIHLAHILFSSVLSECAWYLSWPFPTAVRLH